MPSSGPPSSAATTRVQKRLRWYAAEEELNCFEIGGASGRRLTSVAAAAYLAWEANIIGMVGPGDDST